MSLAACLDIYSDALFYDAEFRHRVLELPFYHRMCETHPGPVLEVACGTGRLTVPLAAAGHDITGLDVAPDMIRLARQKAPDLVWHLQDCREMDLGRRFGLIFMATNALQHLLLDQDVLAFLHCAAGHLTEQGLLILDVFQPKHEKLARSFSSRYLQKTFQWQGSVIEVYIQSEYREAEKILYFELSYERDGRVLRTKRVHMRCFFAGELEALCRDAGLSVEHGYGDYDGSALTGDSPKQILLCRKGS